MGINTLSRLLVKVSQLAAWLMSDDDLSLSLEVELGRPSFHLPHDQNLVVKSCLYFSIRKIAWWMDLPTDSCC